MHLNSDHVVDHRFENGHTVVMYGCESWTVKKAECQRIDAFECGTGEDFENSLDCKEIQPVNPKGNQS